jgi:hypothetical protein
MTAATTLRRACSRIAAARRLQCDWPVGSHLLRCTSTTVSMAARSNHGDEQDRQRAEEEIHGRREGVHFCIPSLIHCILRWSFASAAGSRFRKHSRWWSAYLLLPSSDGLSIMVSGISLSCEHNT